MAKPKEYIFTIGTYPGQWYRGRFINQKEVEEIVELLKKIPRCFEKEEDIELEFTLRIVEKESNGNKD